MVNNNNTTNQSISAKEVNTINDKSVQASYINTGMCPIVGVCAHGPNANQLKSFSENTYAEHGWTPGNMLAGPLNEEGTENIKFDISAELEQFQTITNDAYNHGAINDASNTKKSKKNVKQIKVGNSQSEEKIKELEERIAYLEYITTNIKSQLAEYID